MRTQPIDFIPTPTELNSSSNYGQSEAVTSSNTSTEFIFRQLELPCVRIENCIALYNSGIYEDPSSADSNNRIIGFTNAFQRGQILNKFFQNADKEEATVIKKFVHLIPHKHSEILHHTHCQKEMRQYPIRYFVAIQHSGYSGSGPHRAAWAKHRANETKTTTLLTTLGNELTSNISFDPLRLERKEDLETFPLRAYCQSPRIKRKSSHTNSDEKHPTMRIFMKSSRGDAKLGTTTESKAEVSKKDKDVETVGMTLQQDEKLEAFIHMHEASQPRKTAKIFVKRYQSPEDGHLRKNSEVRLDWKKWLRFRQL